MQRSASGDSIQVHCVDLGESFPTSIYLKKSAHTWVSSLFSFLGRTERTCLLACLRRYSRERAPRSLGKISIHYSLHSLVATRRYPRQSVSRSTCNASVDVVVGEVVVGELVVGELVVGELPVHQCRLVVGEVHVLLAQSLRCSP